MNEMQSAVREKLKSLSEEGYRQFASGLIPGCDNMLGVRIPRLQKLAKQIAKDAPIAYLQQAKPEYFEETMLMGLVIGNLSDPDEMLEQAARFIPQITNWSVCDSFCAGLKLTQKYPQRVWEFLQPYWQSECPYEVRFAVVMMLDYFIDREHLPELFSIFDRIRHPDYYVKMAVAWAISVCYPRFPQETMAYLQNNRLDDETYNKALQKIRESRKVDPDTKAILKEMKRK